MTKKCHYCDCNAVCVMGREGLMKIYIERPVCDRHRDKLLADDAWDEIRTVNDGP